MNRTSLVLTLSLLVHSGLMPRAQADHYLKKLDEMLEDGVYSVSVDSALERLNG